jgi:hypothetical protein
MTKREFRGDEGVPEPDYPTKDQLWKYALLGVVGVGALAATAAVAYSIVAEPALPAPPTRPPPELYQAPVRHTQGKTVRNFGTTVPPEGNQVAQEPSEEPKR